MAQDNSTANVVPFGRRNPDPEIARRHAQDIPPVFHRASQSERMELLTWMDGVFVALMDQHVAEYHKGGHHGS
jgi:hypothetical protein